MEYGPCQLDVAEVPGNPYPNLCLCVVSSITSEYSTFATERSHFLKMTQERVSHERRQATDISITHHFFWRQNPKLHLLRLSERGRRVRKLISEYVE
jgi:hypothetical protein